ncbi:MAG TPA: asparagine synthase-related protein [Solirubrobacterales bacterium]|nr:asparagine synthase-related protein [Solirubrobacterales bacterium]
MLAPHRAPLACGALGSYDRERVLRIAARLGCFPRPVHEDSGSILLLDREPIEWSGARQRGLAWLEGEIWRPQPLTDWQAAATHGLTGLVVDGRKRYLHTSLNGLAPVYWMEDGGAVYFASRIDPLVRTAPRRLSIDWQAWAAIVAMRHPLGERTPFAEVRRLPNHATLRRRLGRARPRSHTWPWEEVEPRATVAAAADGVAAALESCLAPVEGDVVCPLSGGRDSRLLFVALARDGRAASAITVSDDEGATHEEQFAAPVAAALGVPLERLEAAAAEYAADWEERARRVEYQFADHAWLMPVARRIEGLATPVPDGFGIDVFFCAGRHFYTDETLDTRDDGRAARAMFDRLRRYGIAHRALAPEFHGPVEASAWEQYRAATERFQGHPSQPILSLYGTRSVRGVSAYSTALLGSRARMLMPGANGALAAAALEASPHDKLGGVLYDEVFRRLGPAAGLLPSTTGAPRQAPYLPRRWRSAQALAFYRRSLADGPLAPYLAPELLGWLEAPEGIELSGDLRMGMEAVSMLHAWWRRYRDILVEVDPAELLG